MVQLIWTELALQDIDDIFRFNCTLSIKKAIAYSEEFIKAGDRLMLMPEMGPREPLLKQYDRNYRYVIVQRRYKLIYLFENQICSILMVWDCRRNPKQLEGSERFESSPDSED